ncbi:Cytochrome c oxidase assembly protein cox11, mitochondrial [Coemansia aciculifera]|uniref:Cytochrome c oxidase assembly protein cox11, mitochondrial n=1 Tax=Coemansia aciculifera TaxID=417176 RepID=A0A9W8IHC4_9FUNG|nr:Cytochrome c oxidase assembly protein cox11, mitochondrial [Coemansia aciculifera]KAJ2873015.1 Cytochrome c oxidase assembly protein cox11, mitochondrial [Coemansia aciculifera]KAJ2884727.1 Cytochrome c oxidase assembly protein cox11, mitochondrial [Coemansia aciculifera]
MALRLHACFRGLGAQAAARAWPAATQRASASITPWRTYTTPANGGNSQPPIRPGDPRYGGSSAHEGYRRYQEEAQRRNASGLLYVSAFVIFFLGSSYAAVPLYRLLCKTTGFMGTPKTEPTIRDAETLKPLEGHRKLRINFAGQVSTLLDWSFKPEQRQVSVVPGETALAFFKAYNNSDKPIVGIATYNVLPDQAAPYFNKIQCFCFDEQQLDPREEIDMPVFFFIDPEFADDPLMDDIDTITLSYTFFKASGR